MNRPKRLDFEQTFAGDCDYEDALEAYCDILEQALDEAYKLMDKQDIMLDKISKDLKMTEFNIGQNGRSIY